MSSLVKNRLLLLLSMRPLTWTKCQSSKYHFSECISEKSFNRLHLGYDEIKRRWILSFFVTFNIILRHIFPENVIEFPRVVQKIWRNSVTILANFNQFSLIFFIFWHYFVTKKLVTSAYNRWCQHFFIFSIL